MVMLIIVNSDRDSDRRGSEWSVFRFVGSDGLQAG